MKIVVTILLSLLLVSQNLWAQATETIKTIAEKDSKIPVQLISELHSLESSSDANWTMRLVVLEQGLSTDVYARFKVYLVYWHAGEMNNTNTAFYLGSHVAVEDVKMISHGVYSFVTTNQGMQRQTRMINALKVFQDDKALKLKEFQDKYFSSTVKMITSPSPESP